MQAGSIVQNIPKLYSRALQCSVVAILCLTATTCRADAAAEQSLQRDDLIQQVGLQGSWKLGHTCMVKVLIPENLRGNAAAIVVTTLDGDGIEVSYRRAVTPEDPPLVSVPIRIGRRQSVLSAGLIDDRGSTLVTQDYQLAEHDGLNATQPMVLCIGSSMGLEELVRLGASEIDHSLTVVKVEDVDNLPDTWLAYQPCNLVILSASNVSLLRSISETQWTALEQWIRRGGGCIVTLGKSAAEIQTIDRLTALLPGQIIEESTITEPVALESMIFSEQPLSPFPALRLEVTRGQVELNLKDSISKQVPWWIRDARGNGSIQFVTSDLDHPSFASWKHRKTLWERLIAPHVEKSVLDGAQSNESAAASYLGYGDLTGQLRASLDQFTGVRPVGFSHVAGILIAILLLIGPLDYFISVKWLRRPDLSWPIAATILAASAAGLTWYYQGLRPNQIISNHAQIIDIDANSGQIDGHYWTHVYSADARRVSVQAIEDFKGSKLFLDWQGLPGNGLGGLQSQLTMERGMPAYTVNVAGISSQVAGIGIPAAGSKSLYGVYSIQSDLEIESDLHEIKGVDQLEGELVNPLSVELRDTVLFYHRWYYPLKSRMPAGDRTQISSQIIPKDIVRRLNRQQDIDGKPTSAKWDPSERHSLDRLMELMMFHSAATGRNYTSLTHNYQSVIDHSNLLDSNYAILVGRLESSPVKLSIETENSADSPNMLIGTDRNWVRIIFPVAVE